MNNLKVWLEGKLQEKGMTIAEFADKAKVSKAILYMYLTDKHRPSKRSVMKMCEALGCPVEEALQQFTPNKVGRKAKPKAEVVQNVEVTEPVTT